MLQPTKRYLMGLVALVPLITAITVYAVGDTTGRSGIHSGGGVVANSNYTLRGVLGQPVAGPASNAAGNLCSGIECGVSVAVEPTPTSTPSPTGTLPTPTATTTGTAIPATPTATRTPMTATIEVRDNFFTPDSITIVVGDTVTWLRVEGFHNVRAEDGSFRLGETPAGDPGSTWTTVSHTFTQPGTFRYYCEAHGGPGGSGMAGTIIVLAPDPEPSVTPSPQASPSPDTTPTPVGTTTPAPGGESGRIYLPIIQN